MEEKAKVTHQQTERETRHTTLRTPCRDRGSNNDGKGARWDESDEDVERMKGRKGYEGTEAERGEEVRASIAAAVLVIVMGH
jgi:hypothetical protein